MHNLALGRLSVFDDECIAKQDEILNDKDQQTGKPRKIKLREECGRWMNIFGDQKVLDIALKYITYFWQLIYL